MSWRNAFQDWLEYTSKERKGILVLIVCIALLITYNYCAPYIFKQKNIDLSGKKTEIEKWLAEHAADTAAGPIDYTELALQKEAKPKRTLFTFDPNTCDDAAWTALGFTQGQIKSIRNFIGKGGSFKTKADLSKMYVISQEEYEELYPYIALPDAIAYDNTNNYANKPKDYNSNSYNANGYQKFDYSTILIEINSADTVEFKKLKGIGGFLARKIVEYRNKLGGYYSTEQLQEVYRMTPEKVDTIRKNIVADVALIKKINVNTATVEVLSKHPYLNSSQAKTLVAYREQHGPFKTVEGIKKCVLIDAVTYEKVKHYLEVG
jgi:competence protein ComEA